MTDTDRTFISSVRRTAHRESSTAVSDTEELRREARPLLGAADTGVPTPSSSAAGNSLAAVTSRLGINASHFEIFTEKRGRHGYNVRGRDRTDITAKRGFRVEVPKRMLLYTVVVFILVPLLAFIYIMARQLLGFSKNNRYHHTGGHYGTHTRRHHPPHGVVPKEGGDGGGGGEIFPPNNAMTELLPPKKVEDEGADAAEAGTQMDDKVKSVPSDEDGSAPSEKDSAVEVDAAAEEPTRTDPAAVDPAVGEDKAESEVVAEATREESPPGEAEDRVPEVGATREESPPDTTADREPKAGSTGPEGADAPAANVEDGETPKASDNSKVDPAPGEVSGEDKKEVVESAPPADEKRAEEETGREEPNLRQDPVSEGEKTRDDGEVAESNNKPNLRAMRR